MVSLLGLRMDDRPELVAILLPLSKNEILKGIEEINYKYKNYIQFRDKLDCFIL